MKFTSYPGVSVLLCAAASAAEIKMAPRRARVPRALKTEHGDWISPWQMLEASHLAPVDQEKVTKEDEFRKHLNLPTRFALPVTVSVSLYRMGLWETLPDGSVMWRHVFVCSSMCTSLSFEFSKFYLPMGATLHIYDPDTGATIGRTLSSKDNNDEKTLVTPLVQTTGSVVVELDLQAQVKQEHVELEIATAYFGFRGFERSDDDLEIGNRNLAASCNVDVVCSEGDEWRDEIKSVAHISINNQYLCSGVMINNEKQDRKPYFLTAAHCGVTVYNAKTVVAYWNYEKSMCGGIRDGSTDYTTTGSTLVKTYTKSDVSLLLLSEMPNEAFQVAYAGWDSTGVDATRATGIHHPQGHEKSISFENQPTTKIPNEMLSSATKLTHIRVADWDVGVTEGGSSGSPLFDQNKRVIGQLHYGSSKCDSNTEASGGDGYGSFAWSFSQGGLRDYLAPSGTVTIMNTLAAGGTPTNPTTMPTPVVPCSEGSCGNCKDPREEVGCACPSCQTSVCKADPYCCDTAWDEICADSVDELCSCDATTPPTTTKLTTTTEPTTTNPTTTTEPTTTKPSTTTKPTTNPTISTSPPPTDTCADNSCGNCKDNFDKKMGCSCTACEDIVCLIDSYCCEDDWDSLCASYAEELCQEQCGTCLKKVCDEDPYCCVTKFDEICEELEFALCT